MRRFPSVSHLNPVHLVSEIAQGVSIAAFAWYGMGCFLSKTMVSEFDRYGLRNLRLLTGTLQVAGSVGLLIGYFSRPILLFSAAGFALMMFLAVIVRIRIRDPLHAAIPAFSLLVFNLFLVAASL